MDVEETCECTQCPYCGGMDPGSECAHGDICPGWFSDNVCRSVSDVEREAIDAERWKKEEPHES